MAAMAPPATEPAAGTASDAPLLRDRGLNRLGIERTGSRAAGVVVLVVVLLLVIPIALHASLGPTPVEQVQSGSVLRVTDGSTTVRVTVPDGWSSVGEGSSRGFSSGLTLVRTGMNATVSAASGVDDARTYFDRQVRLLALEGIPGTAEDVSVQDADGGQVVSGRVTGSGADDAFVTVLVSDGGDAASIFGIAAHGDLDRQQDAYDALVEGVQVR
ncbi:hypothetical protein Bcav_0747 [Beutenbergia cavernae DSM 12333]|uniref:Uncharacterized protein n=1 Tax=Beutenbergia cavernae (strain ATCC BAA-8 / DSM 12333 / CCUG 43141 / JCM 11478 / NBRC 16432 / NCIMB 13614 / HKI 0122) TaxID=471853 RepID=C5BYQ0_BEUC1|nr:hypothetical protein [Beutenbergia cavernae]ACQ79008.1 hypothetical protein Bcav_0747 [Beutenbergia cavernae DSM 12333]